MKTIFFDFGNVVGFFDHQRAVAGLSKYTDISPIELTLLLYGGPLEDDYERGDITTAEYLHRAKANGRLNCSDDDFLRHYLDIFWRNQEVCDLIPTLKGKYRLGLASNTNEAHYTRYCEQFADVISLFDVLCPSHHARDRKPHAGYFAYCQRFADAEPGECAFVDDLAENIEAAERHGWRGILYRPGEDLAAKLAGL